MNAERRVDPTERDLTIAVTQARDKGGDALRIAQEKLQSYLSSRLTLQMQHKKMEMAARQTDTRIIVGINDD